MNKRKHKLLKTVMVLGTLLSAHSAFADCTNYPTLVANIIEGINQGTGPTTNDTVCVDVPVLLTGGNKIFWNMDTPVTTDGRAFDAPNITPAGLRHMWMMALANAGFVNKFNSTHPDGPQLDPANYHIYGVLHGTAVKWALSDAWWQKQVDKDGNQLYPAGNPVGPWIRKVLAMKAKGLDIQLEVCGVTLYGGHYQHNATEDDVFPGIKVNQGAFGRFQALHQQGFEGIKEGWIDNDSAYLVKGANN